MSVGEWDKRQLCPDGGCTGIIGPDGTCKVCGRAAPNWGDERKRGLVTTDEDEEDEDEEDEEYDEDEEDEDDDEDDEDDADAAIEPSAPVVIGAAGTWAKRRLCPDGACIGVIGNDGKCKVCGKSARPARPPSASGKVKAARDEDDDRDEVVDEDDHDDEREDDADEGDEDGEEYEDDDGDADEDGLRAAGSDDDEDVVDDDEDVIDEDGLRASDPALRADPEDLDNRRLCPDGACVGVIGRDGRCKLCGKEAA